MPAKRPPKRRTDVQAVLRDAEGIVELTHMQLRLATELRRKLQGLARSSKKKPSRRRPAH